MGWKLLKVTMVCLALWQMVASGDSSSSEETGDKGGNVGGQKEGSEPEDSQLGGQREFHEPEQDSETGGQRQFHDENQGQPNDPGQGQGQGQGQAPPWMLSFGNNKANRSSYSSGWQSSWSESSDDTWANMAPSGDGNGGPQYNPGPMNMQYPMMMYPMFGGGQNGGRQPSKGNQKDQVY